MQKYKIVIDGGAEVGDNVVSNSSFDDGLTNWTTRYFYSWPGVAYNSNTDPVGCFLKQNCLEINKKYRISFKIDKLRSAGDGNKCKFYVWAGGNYKYYEINSTGSYEDSVELICTDLTTLMFTFFLGTTGVIDYITATELVYNKELDLYPDTKINLSFDFAPIEDISVRGSSATFDFTVPGSHNNNTIFSHLNVTNKVGGYAFRDKLNATIYEESIPILTGYLQVKNVKEKDGVVEYTIQIVDAFRSFITELGEDYICGNTDSEKDVDFSEYNHRLIWQNTYGSEAPYNDHNSLSYGSGYTYPMIMQNTAQNATRDVRYMRPSFFMKEIFEKILKKHGYKYESNFIQSDLFKHLIYWRYLAKPKALNEDFNDMFIDVSNDNEQRMTTKLIGPFRKNMQMKLGHINTMGSYQNYSYPNMTFKCNREGTYKFKVTFDLHYYLKALNPVTWNPVRFYQSMYGSPDTLVQYDATSYVYVIKGNSLVNLSRSEESVYTFPSEFNMNVNGEYTTPSSNITFETDELYLQPGEELYFKVAFSIPQQAYGNGPFYLGFEVPLLPGPIIQDLEASIDLVADVDSFNLTVMNVEKTLTEGEVVDCNQFFANIKKADFIKDVFTAFNLYIHPKKLDQKTLIIKTRDDFYSGATTIDTWNLDYASEFKMEPPKFYNKNFLLSYIDDSDQLNKVYKEGTKVTYGEKLIENNNDPKEKIDIKMRIFAPTPLGKGGGDIVCPIVVDDSGTLSSDFKPRMLYLYGRPGYSISNYLTIHNGTGNLGFGWFLQCGHIDFPYQNGDTIDLDFGAHQQYLYDQTGNIGTVTNNNLFNLYYKKMLDEYSDENMMKATAYFRLTNKDINELDFARPIVLNRGYGEEYWRINSIEDYNSDSLTKVELIKLINNKLIYEPRFTANTTSSIIFDKRAISNSDAIYGGDSNSNLKIDNSEGGNVIGAGSTNIYFNITSGCTVVGNNSNVFISNSKDVYIKEGLKNINITSTNNIVVDRSDLTIINGMVIGENITYPHGQIVDGGYNENQNPFSSSITNVMDGGMNSLRNLGSFSNTNITEGN